MKLAPWAYVVISPAGVIFPTCDAVNHTLPSGPSTRSPGFDAPSKASITPVPTSRRPMRLLPAFVNHTFPSAPTVSWSGPSSTPGGADCPKVVMSPKPGSRRPIRSLPSLVNHTIPSGATAMSVGRSISPSGSVNVAMSPISADAGGVTAGTGATASNPAASAATSVRPRTRRDDIKCPRYSPLHRLEMTEAPRPTTEPLTERGGDTAGSVSGTD